MTKTARRMTFLLVATLANMLLTLILIVALVLAWSWIASLLGIRDSSPIAVMVSFVGAVVLSGFIYSRALKALRKRPDLEERFGLVK